MHPGMPRVWLALSVLLGVLAGSVAAPLPGPPAQAAPPKCRKACADTTAPAVAITAPTTGSSVTGTVTVRGTSGDNVAVSSVSLAVDGGAWTPVSGTSSWSGSWSTASVADGTHTLAARVVDSSGNAATTSVAVHVANPTAPPPPPPPPADTTAPAVSLSTPGAGATVSGTVTVSGGASDETALARVEVRVDAGAWTTASGASPWSWSWATAGVADGAHTLTARATDTAGNTATSSRTVTVANAPAAPGVWTSPEGVRIDIQTTAGGWTPEEVYAILAANALDLSRIGAGLTVVVQDKSPTFTTTAASTSGGVYTSVRATMQLDARPSSAFSLYPHTSISHEFGHYWMNHWGYLKWQRDWSGYLAKRWASAEGATTLATDARTGSSYSWDPGEIAADDYRLLFGTPEAIAGRNASLNMQIPDPRTQPGLADWLRTTWAG